MTAWTDLGVGVRVRRSRAYAMNTTLLLDPRHAVLVDPGVLPSELDEIAAALREAAPGSLTLLFTHAHWDHVLGRPWWPWAALVAHPALGPALERGRESIAAEAATCAREHGEEWTRGFEPSAPQIKVAGFCEIRLPPWILATRDAPGHCDSQITIQLPARRLLIAGDMLSDLEIPWLDREPAAYRRTLEELVPLAERGEIEILIPGHGAIAHGAHAILERLRNDIRYLEALEAAVAEARAKGLAIENAGARLAALAHPALRAPGMAEVHRENLRIAWERAAGATA